LEYTEMASYPALQALALQPLGEHSFKALSVPSNDRAVVFGGQLLGQLIVAAKTVDPAKEVRSVHVIFARAGEVSKPLQLATEALHVGRTMSSLQLKVSQGARVLCGGLVLCDSTEPDVLRASVAMPDVPGPQALAHRAFRETDGSELRFVDDVDVSSEADTGPAELRLWARWDDPETDDLAVHQALAAWVTDPWLIPAAMRPHKGIGLARAHHTLSTGVLTHTLTFHEPFDVRDWLLFSQTTVHGGGGRTYGEGHVFTSEGVLVASFAQENMIRAFSDGRTGDHATSM
jgi:acyl-CoA thioesterase-2